MMSMYTGGSPEAFSAIVLYYTKKEYSSRRGLAA